MFALKATQTAVAMPTKTEVLLLKVDEGFVVAFQFNLILIMIALNPFIAVACETDEEHASATVLAAQLELSLTLTPENYSFVLQVTAAGLKLHHNLPEKTGPLYLDFVNGELAYRRRTLFQQNQQLLRAIGVKQAVKPKVLDLTGGLGKDAFVLACSGCDVTLVERSAVLMALLKDAMERAQVEEDLMQIVSRMHPVAMDSREYLQTLVPEQYPSVIYLDPMYPERKKSALVKKEMRMLRALLGEDNDAEQLLEPALAIASKVVVKRPRIAPWLTGRKPSAHIEGKSTRFDLYF